MSRNAHELIYVIVGKDESLVGVQCGQLLDELLEPSKRATGLFDADAGSVTASEVLDDLRTVPFLTDKRVVLVKDADSFVSDNRPLLEKYFDNPCPTGRLILVVKTWNKSTKLAKKLAKVGRLISVIQPSRKELPRRVIDYTNDAHSKKITYPTAQLLIELTGDDLTRLYSEIDKLALYADADKTIEPKHIEALIGHNRLFNAFAVIDAVIGGNPAAAVESAEYTVVGAFAFHFRRMFNAKALLEKRTPRQQIEKTLRIWGDRDSFFAQLRRLSLKQIGRYLRQLAETDYAIKTGRANAKVAMEQLVLRLCAS
ncbi:MAG: DNA polymerase III subunit delta [Planctomycetota bacterium]